MKNENAKLVAPDTLEIVRMLPANCERVWEYITNPELRQKWFCAGATGNKPGDEFVMDFDHSRISDSAPPEAAGCGDPIVMRGIIAVYEPPHKFAYRWPGETEEDESLVTITLTQDGDQTRLQLVHSRLTNPEFQKGASAGWHAHLDLLVDLASGNNPRDFWQHYGSLKSEYDQQAAVANESN